MLDETAVTMHKEEERKTIKKKKLDTEWRKKYVQTEVYSRNGQQPTKLEYRSQILAWLNFGELGDSKLFGWRFGL